MIPVRETSEVVIIYPDEYNNYHVGFTPCHNDGRKIGDP